MNKYKKITYFFNEKPLIISLIIIILFISIGYSVFSDTFAIDGAGFVRPISDIRITNVSINSETNGGTLNENLGFGKKTFYINGHVPSALGAEGNLIIDVTITNMSSDDVLITGISNKSFSNVNMHYEYLNITPNETLIPAASDYTFQVKISFNSGIISTILRFAENILETLFNISTNVTSEFEVSWNKLAEYNYTINTTPNDALIVLKKDGTIIGTGSSGTLTVTVDADTNIEWNVSKSGYYTQSGVVIVFADYTHNVVLQPASYHNITINATPSDANIILKDENDNVLSSGSGSQSVSVEDFKNITYVVSKEGYVKISDTISTDGDDVVLNITLTTASALEETISSTSSSSSKTGSEEIYNTGYYLIEAWGGAGGTGYGSTSGGNSGYSYAVAQLNYGDIIYYTIGGNGSNSSGNNSLTAGGANGGGRSNAGGGGGGGYTAISLNTSTLNPENISNGKILMIISGGGGGGGRGILTSGGAGGSGANMSSNTNSISNATIYIGSSGNGSTSNYVPTGGSMEGGKNSGQSLSSGSLLNGGTGYYRGGGGGSGYYGGGGGASSSSSGAASGGAGGSNFLLNTLLSVNDTSILLGTNPSSTGGSVYIKYLGTTY